MYTSGDWELIKMKSVIGNYMIRSSEATKGIAITFSSLGEEEEANARLIAAAPELLTALREITDRFQSLETIYKKATQIEFDCKNGTVARAEAAIAKAEGNNAA